MFHFTQMRHEQAETSPASTYFLCPSAAKELMSAPSVRNDAVFY